MKTIIKPGFTLGSKGMQVLNSNHPGWEVQGLTPQGWKVIKDGFPNLRDALREQYVQELSVLRATGHFTEMRVKESQL